MPEEQPSLEALELRLRESELRMKETEIRAKEKEIASSKWLSPVFLGLVAAALGLFGNVIVSRENNKNTQEVEHLHAQSTVILEAIKTNGDTNAACRNLIFFVSLGLLEDTNHTITAACPGNFQGVPSVSLGPPDSIGGILQYPLVIRTIDINGAPLADVEVQVSSIPEESDFRGRESNCMSKKDGECYLGIKSTGTPGPGNGRFIAVLAKRDGYAGSRTNIFWTGTSVVVVLQKDPGSH